MKSHLTRTSMRRPLEIQSIQQMNLIALQFSSPLSFPLSTSPPAQGPQLFFGLFTETSHISICNVSLKVAMSISFVEGLEMTIVRVPWSWFEEKGTSITFYIQLGFCLGFWVDALTEKNRCRNNGESHHSANWDERILHKCGNLPLLVLRLGLGSLRLGFQ